MESLGKTPLNRNPEHAGSHRFESSNSSQALVCDCTLLSTRPRPKGLHREISRVKVPER